MASIVDTSVKHAYSSMAGASVINGTAGSLIGALRAFLVTGWGAKAVDSAVISNGVCRLTFASGKSAAEIHSVISLSGASPAALNGDQRVTAVAAGWVEFKTSLPDGVVTGAISFKMSALGWEEVFSKTNVSVFRATDPRGTRAYLRIDDSNALYARVQMYESMTDVDTGVGLCPSAADMSGGVYWHKRQTAAGTGVYWSLRGDSRGFLISVAPHASSTAAASNGYGMYTHYAGDAKSLKSGDAWCGMLTGALNTSYSDTSGCVFASAANAGFFVQRMSLGVGGALRCSRRPLSGTAGISGADNTLGTFPTRADNGLRMVEVAFSDGDMAANGPRGFIPGVLYVPQSGVAAAMSVDGYIHDGVGELSGEKLAVVGCGGLDSAARTGCGFVSLKDWR